MVELKTNTSYHKNHGQREERIKDWMENEEVSIVNINCFYDRLNECEVLSIHYLD